MNMGRQAALAGTLFAASLTMITAFLDTGQILRIGLGILTVFFLPGFAAMSAVFPARQFPRTDRLLASLGISLAATVCTAVLLAALPIGLTRDSLSIALGGGTAMVAAYALSRTRSGTAHQKEPAIEQSEPGSSNEED
jgi:uncharacterized membrane protein